MSDSNETVKKELDSLEEEIQVAEKELSRTEVLLETEEKKLKELGAPSEEEAKVMVKKYEEKLASLSEEIAAEMKSIKEGYSW